MRLPFTATVRSPELREDLVLVSGSHFKLGDLDLDRLDQISLPKRERDLLRIMMAVYVADRLVRRPRRGQDAGSSRDIELRIDVADAEFWNDQRTRHLLHDVVRRLSGDFWEFSFL